VSSTMVESISMPITPLLDSSKVLTLPGFFDREASPP
jgi:hypothetical protein